MPMRQLKESEQPQVPLNRALRSTPISLLPKEPKVSALPQLACHEMSCGLCAICPEHLAMMQALPAYQKSVFLHCSRCMCCWKPSGIIQGAISQLCKAGLWPSPALGTAENHHLDVKDHFRRLATPSIPEAAFSKRTWLGWRGVLNVAHLTHVTQTPHSGLEICHLLLAPEPALPRTFSSCFCLHPVSLSNALASARIHYPVHPLLGRINLGLA